MEQIGLEAVLQDANFQAGLKRYIGGLATMEKDTSSTASSISKKFVGLGNTVWDMAGRIAQAAAIGFGALTAAAGIAAGASLNLAGDYQASMNVLQATTGATGTQMQQLGVLAKELGADMNLPAVSAADAGIAMTEMAKAGLSVNDIMGASRGVLQLAAAANISNAEAAMSVANALKAFNLEGSRATQIADLLTGAATSSGSSVSEMSMAFQMGAAVANQAGVSIEDFTTMLAEMSQAGIKGSDAGTSIKTMLLRLIAPTDTAAEEMKKLGINIYTASGQMRPVTDIMRDMNAALFGTANVMATVGGRTKEQEDELKRLQSVLKSTEASIRDYETGVKGAGESEKARNAAMSKLYTTAGVLRQQIAGLNGIQGKSVQTTKTLTEAERNAALMTIFGTDAIRAATIVAGKGADAFDNMRDKVTKAGKAQEMAAARMAGFKGAFAGLQSQIETAMLAFAEPMLKPLEDVIRKIADIFSKPEIMAGIVQLGEAIGTNLANAITAISEALQTLSVSTPGQFLDYLGFTPEQVALFESAIKFVNENLESFKGALIGIGAVLAGAAIASALAGIVAAITAIGAPILALVGVAALLGAAWNGNWFGIRDTMTAVWENNLKPALQALWEWLKINIPPAIAALAKFWTDVLQPALQAVWEFIQANVIPLLITLWEWVGTNLPIALQALSDFWNNVLLPAITAIWNYISVNLIPLFEALANVWIALVKKEVGALTALWQEVLLPALTTVWEFISKNIIPIFTQLYTIISENVFPIIKAFADFIGTVLVGAFNGIASAIQSVTNWLNDLANKINGLQLPPWLTPGSPTPFEEGLVGVSDATQGLTEDLQGLLAPALDHIGSILHNDLNVWLGVDEGLTYLLRLVGQESARASGWAANFEEAFYTMRAAIADAAAVADGLLSTLEGIKSIGTITNNIWVITHYKDVYEPSEGGGGGGSTPGPSTGGGGGHGAYQHGGWTGMGGLAMLHAGEFVLSNAMLRGMQSIPTSIINAVARQIQPITPMVQNTTIYNTYTRNVGVTMNPTYQNYQSPSNAYFDVSAALAAARV